MTFCLLAAAMGVAWSSDPAAADPKQPLALFVDLSKDQVPAAKDLQAKQFDVNGLPVQVGSAATSNIGLRAGRSLDLGAGFSVDSTASLSRSAIPGNLLSKSRGLNEMAAGATARYQQSGWDVALFPEIGTARMDAGPVPDYVIGGSVARSGAGGWALAATSRYEVRHTETSEGAAGGAASGTFGFSRLPLLGTELDLDYAYDWSRLDAATATLSHGPSVVLDLDLSAAVNCRVAYRYAFAGELQGAAPSIAWLGDGGQDLSVGWSWNLAAEGIRGTTLTADFAYHQDFFSTAAPAESSAGLNLGMVF